MGGRISRVLGLGLGCLALATAAPAAAACKFLQIGELPVTMEGPNPVIDAKINGQPVRLIADSGAFFNTLDSGVADRFKLGQTDIHLLMQGVNGTVGASVRRASEFAVLNHTFKGVDFVTAREVFGANASGLLGQNFLNTTDTEYDLANGVIRLFHPDDCQDANLAYWSAGKPYSEIPISRVFDTDRKIKGSVTVNGVALSAIFDTGTPYSVLTLRGAARAGIKRGDPGLKPGGTSSGLGWRLEQTWIAPVQSFKIGDEEIRNTGVRVAELDFNAADMLVGADFFLSHRILVANSQRKLYLTYNGGPVFKLEAIPDQSPPGPAASGQSAASVPPPPTASGAEDPKDAEGYVRRAHAFEARKEYHLALADYDRAIAMAPKDATILYGRAIAYEFDKRPELALADLDAALKLKPDEADMLLSRGRLHLDEKRLPLAKADFDAAARLDRAKLFSIAAAYTDDHHYPEAVAAYDAWLAGLQKSETPATALNDRCWVRALGDFDLEKGLADCNAAIGRFPRSLSFHDSRGLIYLRLGRYEDAIRDYNMIVYEQPKLAWSLYCRGLAKARAGRSVEGDADMKAAVAIDPAVADRANDIGLGPEGATAKGAPTAH